MRDDNALNVADKKLMAAIKAAAWDQVTGLLAELRQQVASAAPSRAAVNWNASADPRALAAGHPGKLVALAVAEGHPDGGFEALVPTAWGLLGDSSRCLELVKVTGLELNFFEFKAGRTGEDIFKALRDLMVNTALYRAFLEKPRQFGYNTENSPLMLVEPSITWELVAPKDMINPRRSEMCWGERDTQALRGILQSLGVESFSLGRLQAEAEALESNIGKDNFSPNRAKQWFENRTTVLIA
jgi:hypothetical protein